MGLILSLGVVFCSAPSLDPPPQGWRMTGACREEAGIPGRSRTTARARRPRGHRSREARVEGGKAEEAAGQHSLGGRVANSVPAIASLPMSLVTAWLIRSFSKHSSFGSCQEETHNTAENFRQSFPNIFF